MDGWEYQVEWFRDLLCADKSLYTASEMLKVPQHINFGDLFQPLKMETSLKNCYLSLVTHAVLAGPFIQYIKEVLVKTNVKASVI